MKPLFIYDLETGGTDSTRHAVLQISVIIDHDDEIIDTYDSYIRPYDHRDVDDEALEVTGIERSSLPDFPTPETVFEQLHEQLETLRENHGPAVPVAYNAGFDRAFLEGFWEDSCDRHGGEAITELLDREAYLDPFPLFNFMRTRSMQEGNRQLGTVAESLDIDVEGDLHDAQTDTRLCRSVLNILMDELVQRRADPKEPRKVAYLDVQGDPLPSKISIALQVNGDVVETFTRFLPNEDGECASDSDDENQARSTRTAKKAVEEFLGQHIDQYDSADKYVPIGYKCRESLDRLQALWSEHDDPYLGSFLKRNQAQDPQAILNCMPYAYDRFGDRDTTREAVYDAFESPETIDVDDPYQNRTLAARSVIRRLRSIFSANAEPMDDNPFG